MTRSGLKVNCLVEGHGGVEDNTATTYSVQIHVTSPSVEEQHLKGDQSGHLIQANAPSLAPLGVARLLGACHSLHLNNTIVPIDTYTNTHTCTLAQRQMHYIVRNTCRRCVFLSFAGLTQ